MPDTDGGAQGRQNQSAITIRDLERMLLTHYTANRYRSTWRVANAFSHLRSYFADSPVDQLGRLSIDYVAQRLSQEAAPATIRQELTNLGTALNLASLYGLIPNRPRLASIRVQNARCKALSETRMRAIAAHLPGDVSDLVETAYLTGWRKSELLGLHWTSVDMDYESLHLDPGTTKNGYGRTFPFGEFPRLKAVLERRWRKTLDAQRGHGGKIAHVFHRQGRPIRCFYGAWRAACRRAGLEGYVFHDLRRSAAQNLVRSGVPMQHAMALLGHRTRSVFDRYAIVDEEDLRRGVARYAERMGAPSRSLEA